MASALTDFMLYSFSAVPVGRLFEGLGYGVLGMRAGGGLVTGAANGVPSNAMFAQKTFGKNFAGQSVEDVAAALRGGTLNPADVPVSYIVRDGQSIILNTRSAQALESAGIPRSAWNGVNATGDSFLKGCLMVSLAVTPTGRSL